MHERHDAPHEPRGIPVTEAARLLGVAPSTVRRRIREGTIEAVRVLRPQGSSWRVILPSGASEQRPRAGAATADGASHAPAQEEARATAGATPRATARPAPSEQAPASLVFSALVGELVAARELAERRAETIADLSERLGYVTAERDAARAELEASRVAQSLVEAPTAPERPEPTTESPRPFWRILAPWLPILVLLAIVLAALR